MNEETKNGVQDEGNFIEQSETTNNVQEIEESSNQNTLPVAETETVIFAEAEISYTTEERAAADPPGPELPTQETSQPALEENSITKEQSSEDNSGETIAQAANVPDTSAETSTPVANLEADKHKQMHEAHSDRIDLDRIEAKEKQRLEEKRIQDEKINAVIDKLREYKESKQAIEVVVKARIRGGLRVDYEDAPLFMPASHFGLKKSATEEELVDAIGHKMEVVVHEIHDNANVRNSVIVSRKTILEDELWSNLKVGEIVEGRVSSIASFGVFLDLGCVEGLIHISRLSKLHVDDPTQFVKKGDMIKAIVQEVDREKSRVSLSRKELEESPWKGISTKYLPDSVCKGIVRRMTDFGTYIELQPGIDGLLRMSEMSWTKRVKHPSDVFQINQEIEVYVLNVNEEKQTISLSFKRTLPNPWQELKDKYAVNSEHEGRVLQVVPQGVVVTVGDEVDGFMPRSRMKAIMKGNKIPLEEGQSITVIINDILPDEESLILSPKVEDRSNAYRSSTTKENAKVSKESKDSGTFAFTFDDFLTDEQKKELMKNIQ